MRFQLESNKGGKLCSSTGQIPETTEEEELNGDVRSKKLNATLVPTVEIRRLKNNAGT